VLTKGAVPGISQLDEDELRAGIDEAHRHGMKCAAHAIGSEGTKNAIRAGIDSVEHGHLIDEEGALLMAERGTFLVPTLCAIDRIVEAGCDAGLPEFVLTKARVLAEKAAENLLRARGGCAFCGWVRCWYAIQSSRRFRARAGADAKLAGHERSRSAASCNAERS
jgi:imidazolonepropionase-like amidohydrolase